MPEPAGRTDPRSIALFPSPVSRMSLGDSIVLVTTAIAGTPSPASFADLTPNQPDNYAVVQDLIVIDYTTLQCLALPGQPARLQVQWKEGRSLVEAREFARRFFAFAAGPSLLGINFTLRFDFADAALDRVIGYLDTQAVRDLTGADLIAAGIKLKFQYDEWRVLLAIDPAGPQQLSWHVNFERDIADVADVEAGLSRIEALAELRDTLIGRLPWR